MCRIEVCSRGWWSVCEWLWRRTFIFLQLSAYDCGVKLCVCVRERELFVLVPGWLVAMLDLQGTGPSLRPVCAVSCLWTNYRVALPLPWGWERPRSEPSTPRIPPPFMLMLKTFVACSTNNTCPPVPLLPTPLTSTLTTGKITSDLAISERIRLRGGGGGGGGGGKTRTICGF